MDEPNDWQPGRRVLVGEQEIQERGRDLRDCEKKRKGDNMYKDCSYASLKWNQYDSGHMEE